MLKRTLSLVLILAMLLGVLPVFAQGEEPVAAVESDRVTVQANNELGQLLTQDISRQQEQQAAGYTVTALEIRGNEATVIYETQEEANLVVAVYSQDKLQLLASGKTRVSPDQTQALVTIEGTMPRYFHATAFLLDCNDLSPLCPAYETPMYTKAMQELLASTVEDYEQDRVLNLDADATTNFVVCSASTRLIQSAEGVNTVTLADSDAKSYIIENIDEQIGTLAVGNVFVYRYDAEHILVVKVASIALDGTTATITGTEVDPRQVFDTVKISGTADVEDMAVDTSVEAEGVTYLGKTTDMPQPRTGSPNHSFHEASAEFDFNVMEEGCFSFVGKGKVEALTSIEYYLAADLQYLNVKVTFSMTGEFEIKLENDPEGLELPMLPLEFPVVPGISVDFTPTLVAQISISFTGKIGMESVWGIGVTHDSAGMRIANLCRTPSLTFEVKLEGKLFIGLKLAPAVQILDGALADAKIEGELGFDITGKLATDSTEGVLHECFGCIDGDVVLKLKITPKVTLLNNENLTLSVELVNSTKHLKDFYICMEHERFGDGNCNRIKYLTAVLVLDDRGRPVANARIVGINSTPLGLTNSSGVLQTYLYAGNQEIKAYVGDVPYGKNVIVTGPGFLQITGVHTDQEQEGGQVDFAQLFDTLYDFEATHRAQLVAADQCGENVYWRMYDDGTLFFYGMGAMGFKDQTPETVTDFYWYYSDLATSLVFAPGITDIPEFAFYEWCYLRSVSLPNTLKTIGDKAFSYCSLPEITLPEGLERIGEEAFYGNDFVDVLLPESLKSIGTRAFSSLVVVGIPAGVSGIGDGAFEYCGPVYVHPDNHWYASDEAGVLYDKQMKTLLQAPVGLKRYTVPLYVTRIGDRAFAHSDLEYIYVSITVTDIGEGAFSGCHKLSIANIPSGVTELKDYTFSSCENLAEITLPEGLISIGENALDGCRKLSSIQIPESVTQIGYGAFQFCSGLVDITIPQGVTKISDSAFAFCSNLAVVDIPDSVTSIGRQAFQACRKLTLVNYGGSSFQWRSISIGTSNDPLTKANIVCNSPIYAPKTKTTGLLTGTVGSSLVTGRAIFTGETQVETDWYTCQVSRFTGLVPGEQYVLVVLADVAAEDPLAPENLLCIQQAVASEEGTLEFRYIHRTFAEQCYPLVCGASNKNLADAQILFPEVYAGEELTPIRPTVVYDGRELIQGVDYVLTGDAFYSEAGQYTCAIRGIYNYSGLVTCSYTVLENGASLSGSVTCFGDETQALSLRLLQDGATFCEIAVYECSANYRLPSVAPGSYTLEISKANHVPRQYPVTLEAGNTQLDVEIHLIGDINGDGRVNVADVSKIYAHSRKVEQLTDYEFLCADVSNDGRVNVSDTSKVYSHAKKTAMLW